MKLSGAGTCQLSVLGRCAVSFPSWLTWLAVGVYSFLLELKRIGVLIAAVTAFQAGKLKVFQVQLRKAQLRRPWWVPHGHVRSDMYYDDLKANRWCICCPARLVCGPCERRHRNTKPGYRFNVLNSWLQRLRTEGGWTHKRRWTATKGGKARTTSTRRVLCNVRVDPNTAHGTQ